MEYPYKGVCVCVLPWSVHLSWPLSPAAVAPCCCSHVWMLRAAVLCHSGEEESVVQPQRHTKHPICCQLTNSKKIQDIAHKMGHNYTIFLVNEAAEHISDSLKGLYLTVQEEH